MLDGQLEQRLSPRERRDLNRLWNALRAGNPPPTRRDLLRWSAIVAGAVAFQRDGMAGASAILYIAEPSS